MTVPQNKQSGICQSEDDLKEIVILSVEMNKTKLHYCPFCHKPSAKLPRHLRLCHGQEEDVLKMEEMPRNELDNHMRALQLRGDHLHNIQVLKQERGHFIVARRPKSSETLTHKDFLPCPFCLRYLTKHQLSRHEKTGCKFKKLYEKSDTRIGQQGLQQKSNILLMHDIGKLSPELQLLLSKLSNDDVATVIKEDSTILEVGQDLLNKQNQKKEQIPYIKDRMRELGRLLIEMRKKPGNEGRSMKSFIRVDEWDFFIQSVKNIAFEKGKHTLALKLGYNMKKVCDSVWTQCIKERNDKGAEEAQNFIKLYEKNWTKEIGSQTVKNLHDEHLNKEVKVIKTDDIVKFSQGLKNDILQLIGKYQDSPNNLIYYELLKAIMAYLTVYNRKRAGELARTKLKNYEDAKQAQLGQDNEVIEKLDKIEKALVSFHVLMKIKGKRGRHVSVLVPKFVEEGLDLLVEGRTAVGICESNSYLFAKEKDDGYMNPWPIISRLAQKYDLEEPGSFKSTGLRKHLATSLQVLNLRENEMDQVATSW